MMTMTAVEPQTFDSLDELMVLARPSLLERARSVRCMSDLENWFYSVFWEQLSYEDLRRVHNLLASDEELMLLIVNREPDEETD